MEHLRVKPRDEDRVIPEGAAIINKHLDTTVEEIENGFLVVKTMEIEYRYNDEVNYAHMTRKRFTKDNPVKLDKKVMLADNFE